MKIEECLNELEEILDESWNLPLFKGKVFVDVERIKENFEKIRESLPDESCSGESKKYFKSR